LDQEAIQLNAELDRVRKEIAAKTARNEQLRAQLVAAKTQLAVPKGRETAASHLNKGDSLFKERRYDEALKEFQAAATLDPNSAVAANNVGFAYNKLGNIDEAIRWTEKAKTIDPNRAIAYVNLADLYYQLNRTDEARANYERYLQLAPNSAYAPTARARLGKP
jgi:tetratricopeptide (TPR) repeat protein